MKITDYAISKKVTVYALVVLMVLAGTSTYMTLPREAAPDIEIPFIIVTTPYVGAAPADVENLVTRKIEKKLQGLENVKDLGSTSAENTVVRCARSGAPVKGGTDGARSRLLGGGEGWRGGSSVSCFRSVSRDSNLSYRDTR